VTSRVQRQAQQNTAELARRVPWQVLLESRDQYLDWQEFYHWARSIIDVEHDVPDWLARSVDQACPGFLDADEKYLARHPKESMLIMVRLGQWIDEQMFGFAKQGGWLPAITYYATRDIRFQKASACWSECVRKWQKARPIQYPSFEEWRREAAQCDETAHLLPAVRKERACFRLVSPERLAQAVSSFIDWEALAYWARPALEAGSSLPAEVAHGLDSRCPGFLESKGRATNERSSIDWKNLMQWIGEHFFQEAKAAGWYDAILISAHNHPRAIRTMEYSDYCEEIWSSGLPAPYPSFAEWRRNADRFVDLENS